jgi:beta-galactosidase
MTAYRNEYWAAHTDKALGWMSDWSGIHVQSRIPIDDFNRDHDAIPMVVSQADFFDTNEGECRFWSEAINEQGVEVLSRYRYGMHHENAAIVERAVGDGKVIFMGTYPGEKMFQELVLHAAAGKGILPMASGDPNILVVPRVLPGDDAMFFVINLFNGERKLSMPGRNFTDAFTGRQIAGDEMMLKPYEILLLQQE